MPVRTIRTQVTFQSPFRLPEFDEEQAAGTYDIDTDEEIIEGNERTAYVRVATLIHLRTPSSSRTVTIAPEGLEEALQRDREREAGPWGFQTKWK
jgi:hypothetical protein